MKDLMLILRSKIFLRLGYVYLLILLVAVISSFTTYLLIAKQTRQQSTLQQQVMSKSQNISSDNSAATYQENVDIPQDNSSIIGSSSAQIIMHGPRNQNRIALTFDAEMTRFMRDQLQSGKVKSSYDKRIVDILNQTNTKATFFLTGMWITLYPSVTKELANNSLFELGSHSYTDSSFNGPCYGLKQLSDTQAVSQVGEAEFLLKVYAGIENQLFRFPGGCYSQNSLNLIAQASDVVVHWDVAGGDGFNNNTQGIINTVISNTQNGSIIILHLNGAPTAPKTAEALPEIISRLKARGFVFVKVNELLGLPPESK